MACPHCPHCQRDGELAVLRLPSRPKVGGRTTIDRGFYLAFAAAYERARATAPQPMRLLREANPWLTASQCKEYLKRARRLGLIATDARPPAEPVAASAVASPEGGDGVPALAPDMREWLARARATVGDESLA